MAKKINKNKMQKQTEHKAIEKEKKSAKKKKPRSKNSKDSDKQLKTLTQKLEQLSIHKECQTQIGPTETEIQKPNRKKSSKKSAEKSGKELKKQTPEQKEYKKFISSMCPIHSGKYHSELLKKGHVSLDWYNKIKEIWKTDKQQKSHSKKQTSNPPKGLIIKPTKKITYVQNITFEFMKRLKPKHWLNDQVINSYIDLIEEDVLKDQNQFKKDHQIHLVKTYFAALKMTPERVDREIKKRGLNKNSMLIVPINQDYHWFFVVIFDSKIIVLDSILPKSLLKQNKDSSMTKKVYFMKESLKKCLKVYQALYKVEQILQKDIHIIRSFPQQDNTNDCGMMMLCGIKNVIKNVCGIVEKRENVRELLQLIENKGFWNFCVEDIKFLRFLFAQEILEEQILVD